MEQQKENEMEARGLNGYVGLRLWGLELNWGFWFRVQV